MDFLLTHQIIKDFASQYGENERKSCLAAATIIGIASIKNENYSAVELWDVAKSMQNNSLSILKLQKSLQQLTHKVEKLSNPRSKEALKKPQETPRFLTDSSRRNRSETKNFSIKKIRNPVRANISKRSASFLKKDHYGLHMKENRFLDRVKSGVPNEESQVLDIADKFLADPLLAGIFQQDSLYSFRK